MPESRKDDFKLGCLHGKLKADKETSEAHIQRTIFLSQKLRVYYSKKKQKIIRIFGYEVPLQMAMRGKCIDLMGYDADHNLYLIELKKEESSEKLYKVNDQINNYESIVKGIQEDLEKEFKKEFFFPKDFKFNSIKKMILAPREFFNGQKKSQLFDSTIEYVYYRDLNINKREPKDIINIHIVKRP